MITLFDFIIMTISIICVLSKYLISSLWASTTNLSLLDYVLIAHTNIDIDREWEIIATSAILPA